ncbi:MAG: aspartyl protease family protein [Chthonomonas sp.]|nr:aspartyl protease family protein [Chthonomonas sp.]
MLVPALLAVSVVSQSGAVEVPFIIGDNAIVAEAVINGKKVSCMFDTGFSGTFVLNDNINIGKPSGTMTLRDFVGSFEATTVPLKTLSIGKQKINTTEDMAVVQQPGGSQSLSYNTHANGIMGMEVMQDFVLEINVQRSCFVLHPRTYDITKKVPDNKRTFLVKMLPKGVNSIELTTETKEGKKLTLALDTGNSFYATTHKDVLERIGLWTPGRKPQFMSQSFVASGAVDAWNLELKDLKIFGVPTPQSVWNIIDRPSSSSDHDGTVGFQFLKNFNMVIDIKRRRVWLENFTGKTAEPPKASAGLQAWYYAEYQRYIVTNVTPSGPAEKAGIRPGDMILGINGEDALNIGYRGFAEKMEGELDSVVKFAISRRGVLQNFEVKRAYLFNQPSP